jgi:hypothetical protein
MVFGSGGERVHHLPLIHIRNVGSGREPTSKPGTKREIFATSEVE